MALTRLAAAGLLLLAPRAAALRTLARGGAVQQGDGDGPSETDDTSLSRRHNRTRSLRSFKEEVAQQLLDMPGFSQAAHPKQEGPPIGMDVYRGGTMRIVSSCRMNQSSCRLGEMPQGEATAVYPGGSTRCLFGHDFMFQVFPGARDKLLLHLEGGGACWDELTTSMAQACTYTAEPSEILGFYNRCEGGNPFDDYTVVFVNHCSGDLHAGNATRPWANPFIPNMAIEQRGAVNMRSVIDWIKDNMESHLSTFAFTGESAGAIGVQVWASTLLKEFSYEQAQVLADSYVGIFPDGFQSEIFKELGVCNASLLSGEAAEKCHAGNITIPDVFAGVIEEFPDVVFGSFGSKQDQAQVIFHNVALTTQTMKKVQAWCGEEDAMTCDISGAPPELTEPPVPMEGTTFHLKAEAILESYSQQPNYVSYLQSGGAHSMLTTGFGRCPFINYDMLGPANYWLGGRDGAQRWSAQNWTTNFFRPHRNKNSACERLIGDDDDWCEPKQALHRLA